jgi:uncharacterized membrane protein HdeD (DUF308 family)
VIQSLLANRVYFLGATGFWDGSVGTAIFGAIMLAAGIASYRSAHPPVNGIHPLTLVLIGIGFGFFALFQRAETDTQPKLLLFIFVGLVLLGVITQALSWLKLLPRVLWSSYQRAQEKYPNQSANLDRNPNNRK